jgi:hypothetical protein
MHSAKTSPALNIGTWRHIRTLLIILLGASMLSACSGCNKKSKSGSKGAVVPPPPTDPAPADPTPTTPTTPGPTPGTEDKGEEVPPITVDSASNIDTKDKAALKHLIFETSTAQEAGRYLSEYLIAVFSRETSCVRLKVRPTSGISAEVDESVLQNGNEGTGACEGQKISGEEKEVPKETEEEGGDEDDAAALRQDLVASDLDFITPESRNTRGFSLSGQSASLCTSRIFRMRAAAADKDKALAKIYTKTGRLLHIGGKVRIWVDEEYANVCTGGLSLDNRSGFGYGPLAAEGVTWLQTYIGKLWTAHLQSLGSEMDKIVTDMTATYGPISDIDSSGFIEIFMSPDVNRAQFARYRTLWPDNFRARHEFKPEDLAYYNSSTNPASNEGEILYMFAPDQGGLYNQVQYPSPDSVATNFAKGFLAAQTMNLIIANQKLFVQKQKKMEDLWLSESLSTLASMYYAGNDYMFDNLAHYLTSRPQYIGIDIGPDAELLTKQYLSMAHEESFGMRGFFGWYLHTRLCGNTAVTPCAKIKTLIDSKEYGVKNVEAILGEPFDKIMINFALSVGIGMVKDPAKALAFWDKGTPGLPSKPLLLPALAEVYKNAVPVTEETNGTGALLTSSKEDRTQAGPYPSRDSLLFQTITSDNDMEFKTAANSVAFILVTSLVETKTDVTAFFGKGLNVTFIPTGDRDPETRRIHVEKVSELAHRDLRPVNLTTTTNPNQTNRFEKTYESIDHSVTPDRELWILGSIDNYKETIEEAEKEIGDTDAYTIEVRPCAGKTGADLTACEAELHTTLIQVHIRDFDKELAPMLIVTTPESEIYRGTSVVGRVTDIDKEHVEPEGITDYLCQSERSWDQAGSSNECDNGGLGTNLPWHNHALTIIDPKAYAHNYVNYLMMGPKGFPYPNFNSVNYFDQPSCGTTACYLSVEHLRQHYLFQFNKKAEPVRMRFWPNGGVTTPPDGSSALSASEVQILAGIKAKIVNTPCVAPTAEFVEECATVAALTATDCENVCTNYMTIENKVKAFIINDNKVLVCKDGVCDEENSLASDEAPTTAWVADNRYIAYSYPVDYRVNWAPPVEPSGSAYCMGDPDGTPVNSCTIRYDYLPTIDDIRQQFNVSSTDIATTGCGLGVFGTDFKVCIDDQSWERDTAPDKPYAYADAREKLATDRYRQYYYTITSRAGEVISKPERMQLLYFRTPGTGAVMNVIVGGRNLSQGKYLIRARLKAFELPYHP